MREHNDWTRIESFSELCTSLAGNPPIYHFVHSWDGVLAPTDHFDFVTRAILSCRETVLVVEEIGLYVNPHMLPNPLAMLVGQGRHRGLGLICTSQTPKQVNPFIRSQASRIVSFNQTEPAHIDWCGAVMGECAELLPSLPPYHALDWTPGGWQLRGPLWEPLDPSALPALE